MAKFEIIVGSMLGASEYVADALKDALETHQHSADIHLAADLTELDQHAVWLICSSTHGAGDLPDNIQSFEQQTRQQDLSATQFMLVGLGDSSYDTFCFAAKTLENSLTSAGATMLCPALHIDVLNHPIPEELAVDWLNDVIDSLALPA